MTIVWTASNTSKIQRTDGAGATRSAVMRVVHALARAFDLGDVQVLEMIADEHDDTPRCCVCRGETDEDNDCRLCGHLYCADCNSMHDSMDPTCEACVCV